MKGAIMDLQKAEKAIKGAWVAAVISGSITLLVAVLSLVGVRLFNFTAWVLIDVALIFGLAYGIYRKNRACAVIMFVYFIISKIYMFIIGGGVAGLPLAIVFAYFFFQGIRGTFAYHSLKKSVPETPATPVDKA
jgi:serine/threonine-protein kinase